VRQLIVCLSIKTHFQQGAFIKNKTTNMKQLLFLFFTIILFTNCNNNKGWSLAGQQKGLKACMDQVEGKLDGDKAKRFCSCALDGAMKKWKTYAESEKAADDDPAGVEIGKNCMAAIQGGNDPEAPKKKGGGIFGGGGDDENTGGKKKVTDEDETGGGGTGNGWSKTDETTFFSQCKTGLVEQGYTSSRATNLCNCFLQKIEARYSSVKDANERGGEAAGAKAMKECLDEEKGGN
jgi:hypothetical protein